MKHTLQINARHVEGAIIRIIGLIERRGFAINSVRSTPSACGQEMEMVVEVESQRSAEVVARHVGKLFDVLAVSLQIHSEQETLLRERLTC